MSVRIPTVVLLLALLPCISSKGGFGPCPSVSVISNFELYRYLGTWYEILRSKDIPFQKGDCVQAHYSVLPDGKMNVTNSESRGGTVVYAYGKAYCESDGSGNCKVSFSTWAPDGDYRVLATDYTHYSVVYTCMSIWVYHWSFAWLLSRTPILDPSYETYATFPDLEPQDFMRTNQINCPPRRYA